MLLIDYRLTRMQYDLLYWLCYHRQFMLWINRRNKCVYLSIL